MGKIVLYAILLGGGAAALFRPWIGVVVGYIFAIFGPQFIWFWAFEGVRPFYFIAIPTIIGFILAAISGRVDFSRWTEKTNIFVAALWLCIVISYFFGPYVNVYSEYRFFNPSTVFSSLNKMFLFYFLCVALVDTPKKILALVSVLVLSVVYMTYWANMQYLEGKYFGRLHGPMGPQGSLYRDENTFALLLVASLPFIYYVGYFMKNRLVRFIIWLIIPFGWHAIFLTGSRGGLLGLGVTITISAWRSPRRWIGLMLIPALVMAYVWQGGSVMKERAATIAKYKEERSAAGRIDAWKVATKMVMSHPITGVGLASFGPAFPDFSDQKPRVAHNTFFQLSAEAGIFAGIFYLCVVLRLIVVLMRAQYSDKILILLRDATICSLAGLFVCAMFLSLQAYEVLYYLIALSVVLVSSSEKFAAV